jgi:hypothetical protein
MFRPPSTSATCAKTETTCKSQPTCPHIFTPVVQSLFLDDCDRVFIGNAHKITVNFTYFLKVRGREVNEENRQIRSSIVWGVE